VGVLGVTIAATFCGVNHSLGDAVTEGIRETRPNR
jgi:hypothetical protein